jgi:hypothetical protein
VARGKRNNPDPGEFRDNALRGFDTVEVWQHEIHDDQVRSQSLRDDDRFLTAPGKSHDSHAGLPLY